MGANEPRYWFRAKRYGWGWGLPRTWEGWAVFIAWAALFFFGVRYLVPGNLSAHLCFALVMVGALLTICYKQGEPPRWRFGDHD